LAVVAQKKDIVEYLIERGADVNVNAGALIEAVSLPQDPLDMVKYLIEHGADVNAAAEDGRTVLMFAIGLKRKIAIVKYLVEHGADVNATSQHGQHGQTALGLAAFANDYDIVEYLIVHGADVNFKDTNNKTALKLSTETLTMYDANRDWEKLLKVVKLLYYFMEPKPSSEEIKKMVSRPGTIKNWLLDPVYTEEEQKKFLDIRIQRRKNEADREVQTIRNNALTCTPFKSVPKVFSDIAVKEQRGYKRASTEEESARKKLKLSKE